MTNQEAVALLKKNPISVGCAVVCLAVGVLIYFRSDAIPAKEAELVAKSAEGERHALNKINSHDLKEQYDALVAANKEIDSRFVRASQLATNSQIFYKLESATGVKLVGSPSQTASIPPKPPQKFTSVGFTIAAQGDLTQLLNFQHQLENGEHYCRIMSANLSGNSSKREGPLTLSLTLELLGLP
jgi:hypothetical protein